MLLDGLCILVVYLIFKSLISRMPTWSKPRPLILYVPFSSRNLLQSLQRLQKQSPIMAGKSVRVVSGGQENARLQEQIAALMRTEKVSLQSLLVIDEAALQTQSPALHKSPIAGSRDGQRNSHSESVSRLALSEAYLGSKEEKMGWPRLRKLLESV